MTDKSARARSQEKIIEMMSDVRAMQGNEERKQKTLRILKEEAEVMAQMTDDEETIYTVIAQGLGPVVGALMVSTLASLQKQIRDLQIEVKTLQNPTPAWTPPTDEDI